MIWESPSAVEWCAAQRRSALLLNDRPAAGLPSMYIDSVSLDDFSGGVCAAQLLAQKTSASSGFAILSGPADDPRSNRRIAGFRSVMPSAVVVVGGGWYYEDGLRVAAEVVRRAHRGLFCCNDRLAESVVMYCRQNDMAVPSLVGFDDAPVAERLHLTTIAIPWEEMVAGAFEIVKRRLNGYTGSSCSQIFQPRPIGRSLHP